MRTAYFLLDPVFLFHKSPCHQSHHSPTTEIGEYAHGKIAQDRPFFFGVKGKEIFSRYVYGVVEADWLDELPDDVVSTDRRSVNWDEDATETLYKWGAGKLSSWLDGFLSSRQMSARNK